MNLYEEKRKDAILELSALQNMFVEDSVIGSLLVEDFTEKEYREIFTVCQECWSREGKLELPTVCFELNGREWWDNLGGSAWFCEILTKNIPYSYWQTTCKKLREYTIIRLQEKLKLDHGGVERNLEEMEIARDMFLGLMPSQVKSADSFKASLMEPDKSGISTGFHGIDNLTGGMIGGQLVVVGARTGVGKSVFLMNVAGHAVKEKEKSVLWLGLEMSEKEVLKRFVKMLSKEQHIDSLDYLATMDIISGSRTVSQLEAECARKHYDLIIVDYLQLLRTGKNYDSEVQELGEITRRLKLLAAKQNNIVLSAAQLNRESDKQSRVPRLSDLRGSGSIEQDADVVILIHRILREDFDDGAKGRKKSEQNAETTMRGFTGQGDTDVFIEKNRNGNTGIINMRFDSNRLQFLDSSPQPVWTAPVRQDTF